MCLVKAMVATTEPLSYAYKDAVVARTSVKKIEIKFEKMDINKKIKKK